ncbi:MAG TPA: gliding motility-associated C-terminal domain-containing protein [Saprospiraceae bacterium]|nr:gliding motility-associated C-terminal domain-containing protein [Saprospiraceae bacterium]
MFVRFTPIILTLIFLFCAQFAWSQVTIWQENFSGANQGWSANFINCGNNFGAATVAAGPPVAPAGITYPAFRINDVEGNCCSANPNDGGDNNGFWETNPINIDNYCNVTLFANWGASGPMECDFPAAPPTPGACTGTPADNGHDQLIFEYSIDGGPYTQFYYVCGSGVDQSMPGLAIGGASGDPGGAGTASINGLSGTTVQIRIWGANKANDEFYFWDNVRVSGIQKPTVNPPADITVCSGQNATVPAFTGTGMPAPTYSWTNDNPGASGIGLAASGNGNIGTFATPAGVTTPRVGTITVTPTSAGCPGDPVTFTVTVNPGQTPVLGTADLCTNSGIFSLNALRDPLVPTGTWSGPGVTGTNFNPSLQNGVVNLTFTPTGACAGPPAMTTITVSPAPTAVFSPTTPVCSGAQATLNVTFTGTGPWNFNLLAGVTPVGSFTANASPFQIQVNPTGNTTYNLQGLMDANCNGANTSVVQNVSPAPTGVLSLVGSNNICEGANATLSVNFSGGTAPYTFVIAINGTDQAPITTNSDPFQFPVALTEFSVITLTSVTASSCTGTGSGTATVNVKPTPTGAITPGNATICNGQSLPIEVILTGTAPFSVVYSINGVNQAPINTASSVFNINASPSSGVNTYTLVSVTGSGCPGTVSGSFVITVGSPPTATLSGSANVCDGQPANLTVTFTGTGPYTFNYTANGVAQPPVTTSTNPYTLSVTPPLTTNYVLTSVDVSGCVGTFSGSGSVTVSASPSGSLQNGGNVICLGQTDTLRLEFMGPGPYTFVYSVNGANQPAITTPNMTYNIPVSPPLGMNDYVLETLTGPGCPGTVGGTYSVEVTAGSSAVLSGTDTICAATPANLTINFTGTGPYTVDYTANGIAQPQIVTSNNPFVFPVTPVSITSYVLTGVSAGGCNGTVSGNAIITVANSPTGLVSGGEQICTNGSGTTIDFTFTGPGPYTFVYSANNIPQPPITTSNPTLSLPVNPINGTIYRLVSVTNGICAGTVSGQAIVFVFTPPTATLSGSNTFCNSADTSVMIDFTGTQPFIVVYSIDGVVQPPDTTFEDPYFIPVNTNTTTTFVLLSVESPGCIGNAQGSATITVNYPPSYTNLQLNCNALQNNYTVSFDVLNATLPLTLSTGSVPGTFTGTQFTSSPIPQATGYSFTFFDANNCGDITVSGPSTCNCVTNPGTMDLTDTIEVCVGATATAVHNNNFVNDGNDVLRFILHTNPASPVGTILAWNTTPSFTFLPGMQAGVTYYISAIAGNPDVSGNVDFADICVKISQGTPVVFNPLPTAILGSDGSVCAGSQFIIPVTLTGVPPYSLTWALNGVQQPTQSGIPSSNFQLAIQPAVNTTVTLVSVSDSRCSAPVTDTAVITVNTAPLVQNLNVSCNLTTQTYVLQFTASGTAPFNVSGVPGAFVNDTFTSLPIPNVTDYSFQLSDANNCGQTTISGMPNCACITNAGVMDQTQLTVCNTDSVNVALVTADTLDPNDTLLYILHDQPGMTPIGTILAWNSTPVFGFQPGMQVNTVYYVSAIAGNPDGSGLINLNDPCVDVAIGTPVVFNGLIGALGSFDTLVCAGTPLELTVNFAGAAPFSFTVTRTGSTDTTFANIPDDSFTWVYVPGQSTTIQLDSVSDQYCSSGTVSGVVNITVPTNPTIQNVQTVCDENTATYTVSFDIVDGTAPYFTNGDAGTLTGTQFVSNPIAFGTGYNFIVRDTFNCSQDTLAGASPCSCTTQVGIMNQTAILLCDGFPANFAAPTGTTLTTGDVLVYYLVSSGTTPGTWTAVDSSSTPTFSFNSTTMTAGTAYTVYAVAGNPQGTGIDPADPCISFTPGPPVTWRVPVTASLSGDTTICQGQAFSLNVDFTGQGFYTLNYTANGVANTVSTTSNPFPLIPSNPSITTSYVLTGVTGQGGCTGTVSGSATVTIAPAPQALGIQTSCDFATETYTLTFDIGNGAAPNSTYTITGVTGTLTDTTFVSDPIPSGAYSVTITNAEGCSTTITGTATCVCTTDAGVMPAAQVNVCLPGQASVTAATGTNLDANDVLQYILYQDVTMLPQGILATANTPQFGMTAGMTAGTTYFVAAVAGNGLPNNGGVDVNDPCLDISNGTPVVFHDAPSATLMGTDTVCPGGNAAFQIAFTGSSPFQFIYAVNNANQPQLTAPGNTFNINTNNVQAIQTFTLVSVSDAFCPGTVSGQAKVVVRPSITATVNSDVTICTGNSTTLTLTLTGATNYNVTIGGGPAPIQLSNIGNGAQFDVSPTATTTYTVTAASAAGNTCPATFGPGATVTVTTLTGSSTVSDYNGFNVSCAESTDGSVSIVPNGGTPPITALWNTGATGLQLSGLGAGDYSVVLTDQTGCRDSASFTLTAPPAITVDFATVVPRCFGENNGTVIIRAITGGSEPYSVTLNSVSVMPDTFPVNFTQLGSGTYGLEIEDANGCSTEDEVDVPAPAELIVNVGPDQEIALGDSTVLEGLTNATGIDTFMWSPLAYLSNPDSLITYVRPIHSQVYSLTVQDTFGCIARDEMLLTVRRDNRIFIPNVIKPGSAENDAFTVYGGPELDAIRSLRIYDRWGELLYEGLDVPKNDPSIGWRGRARGKDVMPGVYIYIVDVVMSDGTTAILTGDVTVVR